MKLQYLCKGILLGILATAGVAGMASIAGCDKEAKDKYKDAGDDLKKAGKDIKEAGKDLGEALTKDAEETKKKIKDRTD